MTGIPSNIPSNYRQDDLPYAYGRPEYHGLIRSCPEDFQVNEIALFEPEGEGEHVLLKIRKRLLNTQDVAQMLARLAGVKPLDVGFAGLKDRVAVTTQWFSVRVSGRADPDWAELEGAGLQVIERSRHRWKIQRGDLSGNRFQLVIRELDAPQAWLEQRLDCIRQGGVPNYFGEQRFGHGGGNLTQAQAMFAGRRVHDRHQRGLYLSAARSFLFNRVLAQRVLDNTWNQALPGELLLLDGSFNQSTAAGQDELTQRRVAAGELHPSGPLWGRGWSAVRGEAAALEQRVLAEFATWKNGLEKAGLKHERRSLRLCPADLSADFSQDGLQLRFQLPPGTYATTVLRELLSYQAVQNSSHTSTP